MAWGDCGSKIRGWRRKGIRIATARFTLLSFPLRALSLLSFSFLLRSNFLFHGRCFAFEHATKLLQLLSVVFSSSRFEFGKVLPTLLMFSYCFSTICRISTELLSLLLSAVRRGITHVLTVWLVLGLASLVCDRVSHGTWPSSFEKVPTLLSRLLSGNMQTSSSKLLEPFVVPYLCSQSSEGGPTKAGLTWPLDQPNRFLDCWAFPDSFQACIWTESDAYLEPK